MLAPERLHHIHISSSNNDDDDDDNNTGCPEKSNVKIKLVGLSGTAWQLEDETILLQTEFPKAFADNHSNDDDKEFGSMTMTLLLDIQSSEVLQPPKSSSLTSLSFTGGGTDEQIINTVVAADQRTLQVCGRLKVDSSDAAVAATTTTTTDAVMGENDQITANTTPKSHNDDSSKDTVTMLSDTSSSLSASSSSSSSSSSWWWWKWTSDPLCDALGGCNDNYMISNNYNYNYNYNYNNKNDNMMRRQSNFLSSSWEFWSRQYYNANDSSSSSSDANDDSTNVGKSQPLDIYQVHVEHQQKFENDFCMKLKESGSLRFETLQSCFVEFLK